MSTPPVSVEGQHGIETAARIMRDANVGFLPVMSMGRVVGAVTDRDLVIKGLTDLAQAHEVTLADIMATPIRYCYEETPVYQIAAMMGDNQLRRLAVLDRDNGLVGVISIGDIAENVSEKIAGEALGEIVEER